jgi:hypothetical protein
MQKNGAQKFLNTESSRGTTSATYGLEKSLRTVAKIQQLHCIA